MVGLGVYSAAIILFAIVALICNKEDAKISKCKVIGLFIPVLLYVVVGTLKARTGLNGWMIIPGLYTAGIIAASILSVLPKKKYSIESRIAAVVMLLPVVAFAVINILRV